MKNNIKTNIVRFTKKTGYRLLGKMVDIAILAAIGSAFGLKLVRY